MRPTLSTMGGKLNRDIPETEATTHVATKPTDLADKGQVAAIRQQEEQNSRENQAKQQHIAAHDTAKIAAEKSKTRKTRKVRPSKLWTTIEVISGSLLAFLIEWLRLRRSRQQMPRR